MKAIIERYLPILPFITFAMMAIQVLVTWGFVGWVHYDSQYRTLPKDSYLAELVTAEDYAKLQTHSLQVVKLSNGSTITDRQPVWYETVLPNYRKVGDHYVLVTTVGTAHYYPRWIEDTFPLMLLTVWGLFITQWDLRRRYAKTRGPNSNR
jgi:hypothetical protein